MASAQYIASPYYGAGYNGGLYRTAGAGYYGGIAASPYAYSNLGYSGYGAYGGGLYY